MAEWKSTRGRLKVDGGYVMVVPTRIMHNEMLFEGKPVKVK